MPTVTPDRDDVIIPLGSMPATRAATAKRCALEAELGAIGDNFLVSPPSCNRPTPRSRRKVLTTIGWKPSNTSTRPGSRTPN